MNIDAFIQDKSYLVRRTYIIAVCLVGLISGCVSTQPVELTSTPYPVTPSQTPNIPTEIPTATDTLPLLHPQGTIIYTTASGIITAIDLESGMPATIWEPKYDTFGQILSLPSSIQAVDDGNVFLLMLYQSYKTDVFRMQLGGNDLSAITTNHDVQSFLISPDGRYLAFVSHTTTYATPPPELILLDLATGAWVNLFVSPQKEDGIAVVEWSPDSENLLFAASNRLFSVNRKILELSEVSIDSRTSHGLTWSVDGKSLLVELDDQDGQGSGIYRYSFDTSEVRLLASISPLPNEISWSPDKNYLLFDFPDLDSHQSADDLAVHLCLLDLQSGLVTVVHTGGRNSHYNPMWNHEGTQIAYFTYSPDDTLQINVYEINTGRRFETLAPGLWMPGGMGGAWIESIP